jgi:hypothetical protein
LPRALGSAAVAAAIACHTPIEFATPTAAAPQIQHDAGHASHLSYTAESDP